MATKTLAFLLSCVIFLTGCAPVQTDRVSHLKDLPPPVEVNMQTLSDCEEIRQMYAGDPVATSSTSYFEEFLVWKCRAEEAAVWWYFWQDNYNIAAERLVLAETERTKHKEASVLPDWFWPAVASSAAALFVAGVAIGLETAGTLGQSGP